MKIDDDPLISIEEKFVAAVRLIRVDLVNELRRQYLAEMDEEKALVLGVQVVNYLMGEDKHSLPNFSVEELEPQIAAILKQTKPRAEEKLQSDAKTREIVVATLRMKTVLMFARLGNAWFTDPQTERIEQILWAYGSDFPREIEPDTYYKLAFAYHEARRWHPWKSYAHLNAHPVDRSQWTTTSGDTALNLLNYCKHYLVDRSLLSPQQATLLVLDPQLGSEIDAAKGEWLFRDLGIGTDPDEFLGPKCYDTPQMHRINSVLDRFAIEFPSREATIRSYLRSLEHPMADL